MFHSKIEDHTGTTNVTAFQEATKNLLGIHARKLYAFTEEENNIKTAEIFGNLFFNKYIFKLLIHKNTFDNDTQVQSIVIASEKIDSKIEGKKYTNNYKFSYEINNLNMFHILKLLNIIPYLFVYNIC